jgi:hypothetical protein
MEDAPKRRNRARAKLSFGKQSGNKTSGQKKRFVLQPRRSFPLSLGRRSQSRGQGRWALWNTRWALWETSRDTRRCSGGRHRSSRRRRRRRYVPRRPGRRRGRRRPLLSRAEPREPGGRRPHAPRSPLLMLHSLRLSLLLLHKRLRLDKRLFRKRRGTRPDARVPRRLPRAVPAPKL